MSAPTIHDKALKGPRENLERLQRDFEGAKRAVEVEAAARRAAEDADAKALADAFRQNKDEPKPTAPAVAERHEAAERKFKALQTAIEDAKEELAQAVAANRPDIEKGISGALSEVRAEMQQLLDAFIAKDTEVRATKPSWANSPAARG